MYWSPARILLLFAMPCLAQRINVTRLGEIAAEFRTWASFERFMDTHQLWEYYGIYF